MPQHPEPSAPLDHDGEGNSSASPAPMLRSALTSFQNNARAAIEEARQPELSQFQEWSSGNLRDLLAENGVQVRGASHASHETLVRICDEVFGQDVQYPRVLSIEEIALMDCAARSIQKAYVKQKILRTKKHMLDQADENDDLEEGNVGLPVEESASVSRRRQSSRHVNPDTFRHASMLRRLREEDADDELEVEWRKPSWKFAKRYEAINRPHRTVGAGKDKKFYDWRKITLGRHCTYGGCGEQLDLWDEGKTSEFSQFGSGITNYFKFLKWSCWIMAILFLLHLPVLIINMFGASMQYETSNAASTTFGNLGSADEVALVRIPGCSEEEYQISAACTIHKDSLAVFYALIDCAGTILVIVAWLWLKSFQRQEVDSLNRSTVTASDYTICVQGIPSDTTEAELAVHFANLMPQMAVSAVHLAFSNAKEINLYFKRGALMRKRYNCVQRIRYEKTKQEKDGSDPIKSRPVMRKLLEEREDLTSRIQLSDEERKDAVDKTQGRAILAFVTFETENALLEAFAAYQTNWFRTICCCYPKRLLFKDHRLRVSQAPEPSTIIWENLQYSYKSRFFRKCLTTAIAAVAIFMSIIFTFLARDFQSKTLESASKACPDGFFDLTGAEQHQIVEQDVDLAHCYCSKQAFIEQWDQSLCADYFQMKAKSNAMSYGAGFMVVFMNAFFTWLMDRAGSFEKHHSLDTMAESNMTRVFFLKFINTACLVLLYNQIWLQRLIGIRFNDAPDFNVDWYATGGVSLIIVMCLNIVTPHIGSVFKYILHRLRRTRLESHLTENEDTDDSFKIFYTQEQLNAVYLGPPFCLNYRYTQSLINFYICWMYAISMPLMLAIGAVSFYVSYWVDKWLFCSFYRRPPMYSDEMGRKVTSLVGLAVVLHLIMSLWMMGSDDKIFSGNAMFSTEEVERPEFGQLELIRASLFKRHLVVLEVLLLLYMLGFFLSRFSLGLGSGLVQCLRCIACSAGNKTSKLKATMNTVQISYSSAKSRGVIKGLASYNILQNPKYQEAFGISPEFAENHTRLSSIRGLNTKEGGICTDMA